jgi:acyl-CoA hydrolase
VATEWGVAYLRGYPIRDRANALISISHPDHRDWLVKEAQRVGIFPPKYTPPAGKPENVLVRRD